MLILIHYLYHMYFLSIDFRVMYHSKCVNSAHRAVQEAPPAAKNKCITLLSKYFVKT